MPVVGEIAEATKAYIPQAWAILLANPGYGIAGLNRSIKVTKYLLFNAVVDPILEETTYNPLVIDYVALKAAQRMLTSAAEIVNNASVSRTMFGEKNEQESYLDRYKNLLALREEYRKQAEELLPYIQEELSPVNTVQKGTSPLGYYEGLDNAITDDPNQWDYTWDQKITKYPLNRESL